MNAMAGWILAGLLLAVTGGAAVAQGPRDRECMRGEERIEGECQPISRGARNKGAGGGN